jgi:hypothetical protein
MSNSVFTTSIPTEGQILQQIAGWSSTQPYLQYLPNVSHGWERWGQLDIFFYLSSNKIKAHVEQYVYVGSDERMDLEVKFANPARTDFVELKAWSFLVATKLVDFLNNVKSDAKKIIDGNYDAKYNGGFAWSIGLLPWTVVLDYEDLAGHAYTKPVFNQILDPEETRKKIREAEKAHVEKILKRFSDLEMYKGFGIQIGFVETIGPMILVYWHSQIANGKLHS